MLKNDFLKIFSSINLLLKLSLVQIQVIYFDGDVINLEEIKLPSSLKALEINEAYLQNQITNEKTDKTQFPGDEGIEDYGYITPDLDTANIFPYYLNFMNTGLVSRFINSNPRLASIGIDLVIKHNQNLELFRNLANLPTINFDCGECDLNIEQFRFPPLVSVTTISFSNILDHHHRYIEKLVLNCPNLTSLQVDMDGKFMMRSFISIVKQLSKLKSLTITNIMSKPIFNIYLGQHPNLECLNLEFFPISCIDLSKFDKLPKLKVINLLKTNTDPNLRKAKNILRKYSNWYCIDSHKSIICYSINHNSHAMFKKRSENFRVKINTKRALKDHRVPFKFIENYKTSSKTHSEIMPISLAQKAAKNTQPGISSIPQSHKDVKPVKPAQPKLIYMTQAHKTSKTTQQELNSTLQTHALAKPAPEGNVYTLVELSRYFSKTKNRTSCRVKVDPVVELKKYLSNHDDQKRFKVSLPTEQIISVGINDKASNLKSKKLVCNENVQNTSHHGSTIIFLNKKNIEGGFEHNNNVQIRKTQTMLINSDTVFQDDSNIEKLLTNNKIKDRGPSCKYVDAAQLNTQHCASFETASILSQEQLQIASDELATPDSKDLCNTLINLKETRLQIKSKSPSIKHKILLNSQAVNIKNTSQNCSSESLNSPSCENLDSDSEISIHESEFSSQSQVSINFKTFELADSSSDFEDCSFNQKTQTITKINGGIEPQVDSTDNLDIMGFKISEISSDFEDSTIQKTQHTSRLVNRKAEPQSSLTENMSSICFEVSEVSSGFASHLTEISSKKSSQEFQVSNYHGSSDLPVKQIELDSEPISAESKKPLPRDSNSIQPIDQSITPETQSISNRPANSKVTNSSLDKDTTNQANSNPCIDNKAQISNGEKSLLIDLTIENESEHRQETISESLLSERTVSNVMLEPSFSKKPDNKQQFTKYKSIKGLYSYFRNIPSIFNLQGHLTKNIQQRESTGKTDPQKESGYTADKSGSHNEGIALDSDSE